MVDGWQKDGGKTVENLLPKLFGGLNATVDWPYFYSGGEWRMRRKETKQLCQMSFVPYGRNGLPQYIVALSTMQARITNNKQQKLYDERQA